MHTHMCYFAPASPFLIDLSQNSETKDLIKLEPEK